MFCNFVSANISEGIALERQFWDIHRSVKELLREEIWEGIDPDSLLLYKNNPASLVSKNTSTYDLYNG